METHKAPFDTAHTDVNDDKEDTSAWAEVLSWESGEHGKNVVHSKKEQTETQTIAKGKPQVDNVASRAPKLNQWFPNRSSAQQSIWKPRKIQQWWWIQWATFCIARMRRRAQEYVLSTVMSMSKCFSVCCKGKRWTRFLTSKSRNIWTPEIQPTRSPKSYYPQRLYGFDCHFHTQ